jgi:membrane-bound serine protease (ClpP class)
MMTFGRSWPRRGWSSIEVAKMSALGLILVLIGAALVAAEAHSPAHGALGTAAVVALAIGVGLIVSSAGAAALVAILAALVVALAGGAYITVLVRKVMEARALRVPDQLVGRIGVVRAAPEPLGQVFVDGALWRARTWTLDEDAKPLHKGDACVVERVDGLTLTVRPAEEWELI